MEVALESHKPQFTLVVLQVTSLCNLNCSYCYVPDRRNQRMMSEDIADRVFKLTVGSPQNADDSFDFLFHAGEPMAVGLEAMKRIADRCIATALPKSNFRFSIQTNGVLVNEDWARFFHDYHFAVGVSIDGPALINDKYRVDWSGKGSYAKTLRGIQTLLENGIDEVGCLATVGVDAMQQPDAIMEFFLGLGVAALGFNLEDVENSNLVTSFGENRSLKQADYRRDLVEPFFRRVFELWWPNRHRLRIREFADVLRAAALRRYDPSYVRSPDVARDLGILTIMRDGRISTYAPEFAGARAPEYDDFVVGHVDAVDSFEDVKKSANFLKLKRDVTSGIAACASNCEYYPLCGSSFVSNRWFEYRDLGRPDTFTCEMMRKAAVDVCLSEVTRVYSLQAADSSSPNRSI
jgi:uncharacterized protein